MFGHDNKKTADTSVRAADPSQPIVHTFDQTNGVMAAYDAYLERQRQAGADMNTTSNAPLKHRQAVTNGDVPVATNMLFGGH